MHIITTLAYLLVFTLPHVSSALHLGKWCPAACHLSLSYVTFNDTDLWLSRKVRACRSELYTTSLYLCFSEYCKEDGESEKWIDVQSRWCDAHAGKALPLYHDIVDPWTNEDLAHVKRLGADEAFEAPVLTEVEVPDGGFFERAFTTLDAAYSEYDLHLVYGWYMYYFWIFVVSFGIGRHLLSLLGNLRRHKEQHPSTGSESTQPTSARPRKLLSLPNIWIKKYITIPATFSNRCSQPYGWCTIPPRIQSLTIAAFVLLNIFLCCSSYRLTLGNLYWPEKSAQLLRYVSDRAGIISLANFPLVWLFGMRNDVLMWVTGWGFGTYNAFHRWVARVATVQAVVHSLGYTLMIVESGGWSEFINDWAVHYFWNGQVATMAMCFLLAASIYGMRRAHYEMFLITHIGISIAALISIYYHVAIFPAGEWNIFIWPCAAIWIFDRIIRGLRTLAFDWKFWDTRATITYNSASHLVRVEVPMERCRVSPRPGTYYYMHVLDDLRYAAQSHPFTLAYVSPPVDDDANVPISPISLYRPSSPTRSISETSSLLSHYSTPTSPSMVFLVRPYSGFTSRLATSCATEPARLRVLLEGPYGCTLPLHTYGTVLFIAGGTGIAVALSHLRALLAAGSRTHSVRITWAVREAGFLAAVLREFKGEIADERCVLDVHVTQDSESGEAEEHKGVTVRCGRPDVKGVVERVVDESSERTAVVACGPAVMADQARRACVGVLGVGRDVDYFEESFKW